MSCAIHYSRSEQLEGENMQPNAVYTLDGFKSYE